LLQKFILGSKIVNLIALCQGIDVLSEEDKKEKCQQNATVAHTFAFLPSCDLKRALSTQYN
jgi:hypothetical protein